MTVRKAVREQKRLDRREEKRRRRELRKKQNRQNEWAAPPGTPANENDTDTNGEIVNGEKYDGHFTR